MRDLILQVLTLLEEAKNGRVGACNPPSMPVPSSPLSPQSATALFAISIVRLRRSSLCLPLGLCSSVYCHASGQRKIQRVIRNSRCTLAFLQPGHRCGHAKVMCVDAAATVAAETTISTIRELSNAAPIEFVSPQAGVHHFQLCTPLDDITTAP